MRESARLLRQPAAQGRRVSIFVSSSSNQSHNRQDTLTPIEDAVSRAVRIITASDDATARIWDSHFAVMLTKDLLREVCTRRQRGLTELSRDEMHLAGYPDSTPVIDVCADVQ